MEITAVRDLSCGLAVVSLILILSEERALKKDANTFVELIAESPTAAIIALSLSISTLSTDPSLISFSNASSIAEAATEASDERTTILIELSEAP